jgi:anaerobic magnesium-protoporphyrin IX monomethyl ester cyclase
MRVLLVVPPRDAKRVVHVVPPLGLGYLATSLLRAGIECKILDCIKESIDTEKLRSYVLENSPDIVGFNFFTNNWSSVSESAKIVRQAIPQAFITAGGPHPSTLPVETLKEIPELDFIFLGEAEDSLVETVKIIKNSKIKNNRKTEFRPLDKIENLVYLKNDTSRIGKCIFSDDLDRYGIPAWDLIQPQTYPLAAHGVFQRHFPIAPIITSRGCPYPCTFCAAKIVSGRRVRYRSLDLVFEEIHILKNKFGINEIQVLDDNFTFKKDYAKEFCSRAIENKMGIAFGLPNGVRLETLDDELLDLMREAGFYSIVVGIEAGSERILKLMKKKLTLDLIREKVDQIKRHKLEVEGFFILGYPGETREEMKRTVKFAKSLNLDRAFFGNYVPLPGTESYNNLIKSGEIKDLDWSKVFVGGEIIYSPDGVSPDELEKLQRNAFLKFYLTPKHLWGFIKRLRPKNIKGILKRILFTLKRA